MQVKAIAFNERAISDNIKKDIEQNPLGFLTKTLSNRFNFGVDNIMQTGIYRELAWAYDLRPFLRKFVYKQYGSWREIYALNKTNVRKLVGGKIAQIVEI